MKFLTKTNFTYLIDYYIYFILFGLWSFSACTTNTTDPSPVLEEPSISYKHLPIEGLNVLVSPIKWFEVYQEYLMVMTEDGCFYKIHAETLTANFIFCNNAPIRHLLVGLDGNVCLISTDSTVVYYDIDGVTSTSVDVIQSPVLNNELTAVSYARNGELYLGYLKSEVIDIELEHAYQLGSGLIKIDKQGNVLQQWIKEESDIQGDVIFDIALSEAGDIWTTTIDKYYYFRKDLHNNINSGSINKLSANGDWTFYDHVNVPEITSDNLLNLTIGKHGSIWFSSTIEPFDGPYTFFTSSLIEIDESGKSQRIGYNGFNPILNFAAEKSDGNKIYFGTFSKPGEEYNTWTRHTFLQIEKEEGIKEYTDEDGLDIYRKIQVDHLDRLLVVGEDGIYEIKQK